MIRKIHVTVGIPGSGKTSWAKSQSVQKTGFRNNEVKIWHFDQLLTRRRNVDQVLEEIFDSVNHYKKIKEHILDGLFLTQDIQAKIVSFFKDKDLEIVFHYWEPDIEACLWNDRYRRDINSSITISNVIIDRPIKSDRVKVENHITKRKSLYQMFKDKYKLEDELKSDEWSMGGTYGNCYDSELRPVSGDVPISSFEQFDNLMEEICTNMTFLQYKKIYNHCVTSDTRSEGDYYGGRVDYGLYKCDVKKLYDILIEKEIIDENSL